MKTIYIVADPDNFTKDGIIKGGIDLLLEKSLEEGFQLAYYPNPDLAYESLASLRGEGLVLISTAMAVSQGKSAKRRYTSTNTNSGYEAGLALLEDLARANTHKFPQDAVLFTIADHKTSFYGNIQKISKQYDVPVIDIGELKGGFADKVGQLYNERILGKKPVSH